MPNSAKKIQERLEQIKERGVQMAANDENTMAANLVEEAAGLGLELAEILKEKK